MIRARAATGPAVERVALMRKGMHSRHPEGVSIIYLIGKDAGLPTAEARAGVQEMMARFSGQRACLAIIVQGDGFGASAQRAAITGVRVQVEAAFAMQVFDRTEQAAHWLPERHREHTGVAVSPNELVALLDQLMAEL